MNVPQQESSHIQEAWHSFIDANVDGAGSNREPPSQWKEMKIDQGAITHEMCCLAPQYCKEYIYSVVY